MRSKKERKDKQIMKNIKKEIIGYIFVGEFGLMYEACINNETIAKGTTTNILHALIELKSLSCSTISLIGPTDTFLIHFSKREWRFDEVTQLCAN